MKIETRKLSHVYPSGERALDGVSLLLEGTDPVAVIGQNGAGKTTLVKHFNGILKPTSGTVLIDDQDILEKTVAAWSASVGYIFQNPDNQLFLESVRREFEFGPRQIGMMPERIAARLAEVSVLVGLSDRLDENPADLSPAEKRFCAIGTVVMMNPGAIIFDEPTCGQDVAGMRRLRRVIEALRAEGTLCIMISHDIAFVTRCFPRVIVMCRGTVLDQGTTAEVFSHADALAQAYVVSPPVARVAERAGVQRPVFDVESLMEAIAKESAR